MAPLRRLFSLSTSPAWLIVIGRIVEFLYKALETWSNADFALSKASVIMETAWNFLGSPLAVILAIGWLFANAYGWPQRALARIRQVSHATMSRDGTTPVVMDKGRLLSSLSALQSEGLWLQTEIDNGNITTEYQWAVCDGAIILWFRSIKRTLEAWDEIDKSRLFGFEALPAFPASTGPQEDRIRAMREQIKRIDGRIAAVMRDLKK